MARARALFERQLCARRLARASLERHFIKRARRRMAAALSASERWSNGGARAVCICDATVAVVWQPVGRARAGERTACFRSAFLAVLNVLPTSNRRVTAANVLFFAVTPTISVRRRESFACCAIRRASKLGFGAFCVRLHSIDRAF